MPNRVTASLVVSFTTESAADGGGDLKLELDDSRNGENTSFGAEDNVFIRLIKSSNVGSVDITCTSGSLSSVTHDELVPKEDTVSFTMSAEANLGYPYASGGDVDWMGASGGTATFLPGKSILRVPNKVVAIGKATYMTKADIYQLSGVGDVESVLVYAEGIAV